MYKCEVPGCGYLSKPGERIGGRIPLAVRDVEYRTPLLTPGGLHMTRQGDGYPEPIAGISHGTEVVTEVVACADCAASPPTPKVVGKVVRMQPGKVIDRRRDNRRNSQEEGA